MVLCCVLFFLPHTIPIFNCCSYLSWPCPCIHNSLQMNEKLLYEHLTRSNAAVKWYLRHVCVYLSPHYQRTLVLINFSTLISLCFKITSCSETDLLLLSSQYLFPMARKKCIIKLQYFYGKAFKETSIKSRIAVKTF